MDISQLLINWYKTHQRDLPWRNTSDPYKIWLSEIIMQQTRIDQGLAYYHRFIENFPNVEALAKAEEQEVLRLWQGLGYYSRARNLHKSAQIIVSEFNGVFPSEYDSILKLKGIGEYTASAIAAFAFGLPYAVVDGNVYRFLSRYFLIEEPYDSAKGKTIFRETANEILDKQNPGLHNQAIMEFGSLQCKPQNPDCGACPLNNSCLAFAKKKVAVLPYKSGKTKVRKRFFNYFILEDAAGKILMKKRSEKDVWHNLYDFPLTETDHLVSESDLMNKHIIESTFGIQDFIVKSISPVQIHLLSHQRLHLRFIRISVQNFSNLNPFTSFSQSDIEKLPLPRPVEQYLSSFFDEEGIAHHK